MSAEDIKKGDNMAGIALFLFGLLLGGMAGRSLAWAYDNWFFIDQRLYLRGFETGLLLLGSAGAVAGGLVGWCLD